MFNPGREGFLAGEIDWNDATIKVALVRNYTFNAAHKFMSDITAAGGFVAAWSPALTTKTVTDGVADSADFSFGTVTANAAAHSLVVYQSSAVTGGADVADTAQRLIAWVDTGSNLPIVPNGGEVAITWDAGSNRIFRL